jgi:hypothetical protein
LLSRHRLLIYMPCLRVYVITSNHIQSPNSTSCVCRIPKKDFEDFRDSFTRTESKALRLSTKSYHAQLVPPIAIRCEIVLGASLLDAVDMELFPLYENSKLRYAQNSEFNPASRNTIALP